MLIPRKSQFPGLDRDSRFRHSTYFYLRDRSWIAGGGEGGGEITDRTRRRSWPMTGPHRRLRTINIAGNGAPKTAGGRGIATGEAKQPLHLCPLPL